MQIPVLGRFRLSLAAGGARRGVRAGGERPEDRVEALHRLVGAPDHEAVAPLEPEDAAAGSAVDVVDPALGQGGGAADVVTVVGVAAVDHGVARVERLRDVGDGPLGDLARGDHGPDGAWRVQLGSELGQRLRGLGALGGERLDRCGVDVVDDAPMPVPPKAPDDVGAHPPEAHHSELGHGAE